MTVGDAVLTRVKMLSYRGPGDIEKTSGKPHLL